MTARTKTLLAAVGTAVIVLGLAFYAPKLINSSSGLSTSDAGAQIGSAFQKAHASQIQGVKVLRCLGGKNGVYLCAAIISVGGKVACVTVLGTATQGQTTIRSVAVRDDTTCYFAA